jgi:hypothetical protein
MRSNIRIAVIIPDRQDRPGLTKNCLRILNSQTLQPKDVIHMNFEPENDELDITKRYRRGYEKISKLFLDIDLIAFIENDDYYHPEYLETMARLWINAGKPDMLGLDHTIYYHVELRKHFTMKHKIRSSAMNTVIRPGLDIKWCADNEAYTDIHLWLGDSNIKGPKIIVTPPKEICIGIKHGIGKPGGFYHNCHLGKFTTEDPEMEYLKSLTDPESFDFYSKLFPKH